MGELRVCRSTAVKLEERERLGKETGKEEEEKNS